MMNLAVERKARLFKAGKYEDRGIEVSENDLDAIIRNSSDVEVWVEHRKPPFTLGMVKSLERVGDELWGVIGFTQKAWDFISHESKALYLSVAMPRDKTRLAEVSLVSNPRVSSAAVFAKDQEEVITIMSDQPVKGFDDEKGFFAKFGEVMANAILHREPAEKLKESESTEDFKTMFSDAVAEAVKPIVEQQNVILAKLASAQKGEAEARRSAMVAKFANVPPAIREKAEALLKIDSELTFSNGTEDVGVLNAVIDLLEEIDKTSKFFSEFAPADKNGKSETIAPSDKPFFDAIGVTEEDLQKYGGR